MAPIRLVWTTLFLPTQRKFRTDSMCLRSAPLAAACVTGTYPQNRTVESRRIGLKAACHFSISTQDAILFAVAMFASAPWLGTAQVGQPVAPPPAAGRNQHVVRSRSPHGSGGSHGSDVTTASSEQSVTGFAMGDRFFEDHVFEQQIRLEFLEIPVWKRKNIIVKCFTGCPITFTPGWPLASATTEHLSLRSAWRM